MPDLILFALSTLIIAYVVRRLLTKPKHNYPPGPWGFPIVGHLPLLGDRPDIVLSKWNKKYGPVISVRFGNLPIVVLGDSKLIKEAYNMPAISDRPHIESFHAYSDGMKGLFFSTAEVAKEQRHFVVSALRQSGYGGKKMADAIQQEVENAVKKLQVDVAESQKNGTPLSLNERFSVGPLNAIWILLMGETYDRKQSVQRYVDMLEELFLSGGRLADLAEYVPFLSKLFSSVKKFNDRKIELMNQLHSAVREQIKQHNENRIPGEPRDFTDAYLDKVDATKNPLSSFHESKHCQEVTTNDLALASMIDLSHALQWIFLYLVRKPTIQDRMFRELIEVVGNGRDVTLDDRAALPFAEAVIHESLRLSPNAPLGVMHSSMEDTVIGGYFIPKGTAVMSNLNAIQCDPDLWEDPLEFNPDRFLTKEGKMMEKIENYMPFLVGRRKCLGEQFALSNIFLYLTNLIKNFKFECWNPNEIPSLTPLPGIIYAPREHKVRVTERNVK